MSYLYPHHALKHWSFGVLMFIDVWDAPMSSCYMDVKWLSQKLWVLLYLAVKSRGDGISWPLKGQIVLL